MYPFSLALLSIAFLYASFTAASTYTGQHDITCFVMFVVSIALAGSLVVTGRR